MTNIHIMTEVINTHTKTTREQQRFIPMFANLCISNSVASTYGS